MGRPTIPAFLPTRKAGQPATARQKVRTPSPRTCPWLLGGAAGPGAVDEIHLNLSAAPQASNADNMAAATCNFGHPRATPWLDLQRHRAERHPPLRRRLPDLSDELHEAADPPRRRSWNLPVINIFTHDSHRPSA